MALLALLVALPASAEWHRYSDTAMTTPVELEFWADESVTADVVAREVFDVFHRVDIQMSRYRADSELSALNREAGKGPVNVSDGLFKVLQKAREVSELSEGAFDVTFGSKVHVFPEFFNPHTGRFRLLLRKPGWSQRLILNHGNVIFNWQSH